MLVCIDHGNKQIKTTNRTFTSGLMESDTRPPFGDNIMFYNGKYYTLSDQRIPYIRDKTEDDRRRPVCTGSADGHSTCRGAAARALRHAV